MKIFAFSRLLITSLLIIGCASTKQVAPVSSADQPTIVEKNNKQSVEKNNLLEAVKDGLVKPSNEKKETSVTTSEIVEEKVGVVFGKTDFQGVLKTSYVELMIERIDKENEKFQLHIGDKASVQVFAWEVKTVEPGYFVLDLPEGSYKISEVSIPVGSTMAIEKTEVVFNVIGEKVTYLGTLNMVGTKEKIKLGGVPVIKPGFEYTLTVNDEFQSAELFYKNRFPENDKKIKSGLMQAVMSTNQVQ